MGTGGDVQMKLLSGNPGEILEVAATEYFDAQMACWFSLPRAIEVGGQTFVGGVQSCTVGPDEWDNPWFGILFPIHPGGNVIAVELGVPKRHRMYQSYSDDHNNPSFLFRSDKPPVVFITQHNADNHVKYRVGTTPLDLATLGPPQEIDFTAVGGSVSYSQTWAYNDTVVCICRTGNPTVRYWSAAISQDYCATWSAPVQLIDFNDQGYIMSNQIDDVIHCMATVHPSRTTQQSIWYLGINLSNGNITRRDGTVIANLSGTNLPLITGDLDLVYAIPDGDVRSWPKDVGPDGTLVWAQWHDVNEPDGGDYKHARWDGSKWITSSICPNGGRWVNWPLVAGDQQSYRGGASVDQDGDVWVSRKRSDNHWAIERWHRSGELWSLEETVASSASRRLVRPYCPPGRTTGPRVIWNEVEQYTSPGQYRAGLDWEGKDD